MHEFIVTECEKYPSTKILKDATILDKVIKLHGVHFLRTITNKKHPVLNYTCTQWSYQKSVTTNVSNPSK